MSNSTTVFQKTTDKINLWTQILTAVLYAWALAGFSVDPAQTAAEIIAAIKGQSLPLILSAAFNLGVMVWQWVRAAKEKSHNFWAFWTSRSWLISAFNIVLPLLGTLGIYLGDGDAEKFVDFALAGDWKSFLGLLVMTVFGIIGTLVKKKG